MRWPRPSRSRVQRHRHADRAKKRGVAGGDRDRREDGRTLATEAAGGGLDHALPGGEAGVGVVVREAGQGEVDQARVGGAERVRIEGEALHHAGAEVLDHDVRGLDQAAGGGAVGVLRQVEDDAALAAVPGSVRRALQARAAGRVDADHVRALIGEHHRRQRPGDVLAEVDHAGPAQRTWHRSPPLRTALNLPGYIPTPHRRAAPTIEGRGGERQARLRRRRVGRGRVDRAELPGHGERVPHQPALLDEAVTRARDAQPGGAKLAAGGRLAEELTGVCRPPRPARPPARRRRTPRPPSR
jgi:hypothetical protein